MIKIYFLIYLLLASKCRELASFRRISCKKSSKIDHVFQTIGNSETINYSVNYLMGFPISLLAISSVVPTNPAFGALLQIFRRSKAIPALLCPFFAQVFDFNAILFFKMNFRIWRSYTE